MGFECQGSGEPRSNGNNPDADATIGLWTECGTWHHEAYRMLYRSAILSRLPWMRIRFFGPLPPGHIDTTEHGDLIAPFDAEAAEYPFVTPPAMIVAGATISDALPSSGAADCAPARKIIWSGVTIGSHVTDPDLQRIRRMAASCCFVAARDIRTQEQLADGEHRRTVEIIPDPLLLLPRLLAGQGEARTRVDYLRLVHGYPASERVVVVEATPALQRYADLLSNAVSRFRREGYPLAVVALSDGDDGISGALSDLVERIFGRIGFAPASLPLEERLNIIATATGVVACSPALYAAAHAFGRPAVALFDHSPAFGVAVEALDQPGNRPLAQRIGRLFEHSSAASGVTALQVRLEEHFDHVSDLVAVRSEACSALSAGQDKNGLHRQPNRPDWITALERAHTTRARALLDERLRFSQHIESLQAELAAMGAEIRRRETTEARLRKDLGDAWSHAQHLSWVLDQSRTELERLTAELHERRDNHASYLGGLRIRRILARARATVARIRLRRSHQR